MTLYMNPKKIRIRYQRNRLSNRFISKHNVFLVVKYPVSTMIYRFCVSESLENRSRDVLGKYFFQSRIFISILHVCACWTVCPRAFMLRNFTSHLVSLMFLYSLIKSRGWLRKVYVTIDQSNRCNSLNWQIVVLLKHGDKTITVA